MSRTKITAPVAGYTGTGPGGAVFHDGVAYTDDEVAIAYYRSAGYGVGGAVPKADDEERADAREVDSQVVGTRLRDASVDPQPEDFLAPVNAGKADPHGPLVVAPGIHAIETQVVRPGPVQMGENVREQDKAETEHAKALLVVNTPAREVTAPPEGADRGPLEFSDPGSAELGVKAALAAKGSDDPPATPDAAAAPAKRTAAKKTAAKRTSKRASRKS